MSNEDKNQPKVLVCAPAESAVLVAAGSTFNQTCVHCGRQVVVAPTGQKALALHPELILLCGPCFLRYATCEMSEKERRELEVGLPDTVENMRKEAASARPNFWPQRN